MPPKECAEKTASKCGTNLLERLVAPGKKPEQITPPPKAPEPLVNPLEPGGSPVRVAVMVSSRFSHGTPVHQQHTSLLTDCACHTELLPCSLLYSPNLTNAIVVPLTCIDGCLCIHLLRKLELPAWVSAQVRPLSSAEKAAKARHQVFVQRPSVVQMRALRFGGSTAGQDEYAFEADRVFMMAGKDYAAQVYDEVIAPAIAGSFLNGVNTLVCAARGCFAAVIYAHNTMFMLSHRCVAYATCSWPYTPYVPCTCAGKQASPCTRV